MPSKYAILQFGAKWYVIEWSEARNSYVSREGPFLTEGGAYAAMARSQDMDPSFDLERATDKLVADGITPTTTDAEREDAMNKRVTRWYDAANQNWTYK